MDNLKNYLEEASNNPDPIIKTSELRVGGVYTAFNLRPIETIYGKKVVASLKEKKGVYYFPNKFQNYFNTARLEDFEGEVIKFKFLGYEQLGAYKTPILEILN
jgi:hypothetical protein